MAQDSKKAKPIPDDTVPLQTNAPDSLPDDADAMLTDTPISKFNATTEQFTMKPAEKTEQFTLTPGEKDAPEALVGDPAAGAGIVEDTEVCPPPSSQRTQYQGKTVPVHAENAAKKKPETATKVDEGAASAAAASAAAASAAADSKESAKTRILGHYKCEKKLGQGGMGTVWKAYDQKFDRVVALKVLSKELASNGAFVQRFEREAKVMAKLDHPNILRCLDRGEAQGHRYLVMEFVDGGSVEDQLRKHKKFDIGDALFITLACAAALEHAHELGLVHRDIKPDNVLLTKKGVIKVADLGLAKAIDDDMQLTKTGTGAGTPVYMAPEQARDAKHVDGTVDIYALGCMLYVFLTGETPFKGETLVELIEDKEKDKPAPVRKFNVDVPDRLDMIVQKMIALKPAHRYASCAEVIDELKGLGLHHDHLSFLEETPAQAKTVANKSLPVRPTDRPQSKGSKPTSAPAAKAEPASSEDLYYWRFENDGKSVKKKMRKDQLITLIKSNSIDAHAQVSKSSAAGYRALGTYVEFANLFKGAATKKEADKKGEKFREVYKTLAQQEISRQRWRWIHNMYLRAGGLIGFILWLAVLCAICVGGFYGVKFLITYIGEKITK